MNKRSIEWTVVAAVLASVAVHAAAGDETWRTGRRNGTVHGPGTLAEKSVSFVQVASFGGPCDDIGNPLVCAEGGADHVAAGAGLRNAGHATIRLRGAPAGAVLEAAYLYVGLIEGPSPGGVEPLVDLTFEGVPVAAVQVASQGRHCWEEAPGMPVVGQATLYRASVGNLLAPGINGDYRLAGVPSAVTGGGDPFRCAPPACDPLLPLGQGVSLVAVWRHRSVPEGSRVYLHEADVVVPLLTDGLSVRQLLTPPGPEGWASLRFTSIGGDGQTRDPDSFFQPLAPITTALDLAGATARIRGPGSEVEPNADWTGMDGGSIPQLWGTRITDVDREDIQGGAESPAFYEVRYQAQIGPGHDLDCVNPVVHVISLYSEPVP